jgi:hypothetical protein
MQDGKLHKELEIKNAEISYFDEFCPWRWSMGREKAEEVTLCF